jgi:hypothetical protein
MTGHVRSALGVLVLTGPLAAQVPPPQPLPPTVAPQPLLGPTTGGAPDVNPGVPLPQREVLVKFDRATATARRFHDSTQVWVGGVMFRDFGRDHAAAEEAARAIRDLRPTEWGVIGGTRPVVEYGLFDGKAPVTRPDPKWSQPIDLASVRAENVRGTWVLADDGNILLNFGPAKADAEMAAAVCRKYGFNRIGFVSFPTPVMSYFYYQPSLPGGKAAADPTAALARAAQEQALTRTGIPVPGVGFVGEKVAIDPRKVEVRRDKGEYVLAHGADVLGRFGANEWTARDALKVVQDGRYTEFCKVGTSGVSFFLVNGQPPTKVPLSAQGSRFDPAGLKVRPADGRYGVFEDRGRMILPAATQEEGEQLVKVVQAFGFDQVCQVGLSSRASLKFLAKTGR